MTGIYIVENTTLRFEGKVYYDGDIAVDPPEYVLERYDRFKRVDDREALEQLPYQTLQKIAAEGNREGVDGKSKRDDIIDAYSE